MKYDFTGKSQAERDAILAAEARKPPVYLTADGQRVELKFESARGPLLAPWPAPGVGLVEVDPNDPYIRRKVYAEVGYKFLSADEYRDALEFLAREKGWRVVWPAPVEDPEPPAVVPQVAEVGIVPPAKRRGRPPGSKNKAKK